LNGDLLCCADVFFIGPNEFLCIPTTPDVAAQLSSPEITQKEYFGRMLLLTCIAGVGRLPQVSMPLTKAKSNLPIGLSLLGAQYADAELLGVVNAISMVSAIVNVNKLKRREVKSHDPKAAVRKIETVFLDYKKRQSKVTAWRKKIQETPQPQRSERCKFPTEEEYSVAPQARHS